ncbi:extracellular solute-binding protein [Paenibacillus yanchengensis]|uniref:Extracellular solute-binding protein n=1 Tax=Paenibacillus yanchengensis TaxID=2035833 RepID=A0ABW4YHN4_9BACL
MKRNVKVMLSVMLAVMLVLTACAKGGGGNEKPSNSPSTPAETSAPVEGNKENNDKKWPEKVTVKAYMSSFGDDSTNTEIQQEWLRRMQEHVGAELDIKWTYVHNDDYKDKVKLMAQSGGGHDIMSGTKDNDIMFQLGNQGALLDIAPYIDEYAPNYKKYLEANEHIRKSVTTADGKMYFFGDGFLNNTDMVASAYGPMYRFDIFQKHDIKIPETWEEYYEAAKKLKELYPDVYPVNAQEWPPFQDAHFYSNHTQPDIYWNGTEFVFGPGEESFKEAFEFIAKMYNEKLLDPEFSTQTQDQLQEKATNGKVFMIPFAWLGWKEKYAVEADGVVWGGARTPKNEKYGEPYMLGPSLPGTVLYPNYGTMISADTKYPELMVSLLDYQYEESMIELIHWGIEGKTYEVVNGEKVKIDLGDDAALQNKLGYGPLATITRPGFVFSPQYYATDVAGYRVPEKMMPFFANGEYLEGVMAPQDGTAQAYAGEAAIPTWETAPQIRLSKDQEAQKIQTMTAVKTYLEEGLFSFVLGQRSFDEWDKFQEELKAVGDYQAIVDMMNEEAKK